MILHHDLQTGDRVVDLTAQRNHWADVNGEVLKVEAGYVMVRYEGGNVRVKAASSLRKEGTSVYIVTGEIGEYSDHALWLVAACPTEAEAVELTAKLNALAAQAVAAESWEEPSPTTKALLAADPQAQVRHYDTIAYRWEPVPSGTPLLKRLTG